MIFLTQVRGLACQQQIPWSQERRLFLKKGNVCCYITEGILGSYEGKAPGSCLSWTKVSQMPLLRHWSSQCCNVLLDMSGHTTFTVPCIKANETEACVSGSTNTWAFSKYPWSYGAKSTPQSHQMLNLLQAMKVVLEAWNPHLTYGICIAQWFLVMQFLLWIKSIGNRISCLSCVLKSY